MEESPHASQRMRMRSSVGNVRMWGSFIGADYLWLEWGVRTETSDLVIIYARRIFSARVPSAVLSLIKA